MAYHASGNQADLVLLLILNIGSEISIGFEQIFLLYNPLMVYL